MLLLSKSSVLNTSSIVFLKSSFFQGFVINNLAKLLYIDLKTIFSSVYPLNISPNG